MHIKVLTTGYLGSHIYLIEESGRIILIDIGDADIVRKELINTNYIIDYGILTHEHCDHIYGCSAIRDEYHCAIISSRLCNENIKDSRTNSSKYFESFIGVHSNLTPDYQKWMPPFTTYADRVFDDELTIDWMEHRLYMRETPGHSQGSICIIVDDSYLFSGDTLMKDVVTETRFKGGSAAAYHQYTLPWLMSLSPNMIVYPGHGDVFRLGEKLKK